MEKLIVNFTPTGMIPTKDMTPHIPICANEIVEDVHRAVEIGITMIHLHARDEVSGQPTYQREVYGKIIEGIRQYAPDIILCVSLSGRNFNEFEKRSEVLSLQGNLKPDMGSLTLSSLNFSRTASVNSPEMVQKLAVEMLARGILPELEVFDIGMVNYAKYLEKKQLIKAPHYFNLLFGNVAGAQADLHHVGLITSDLPEKSWYTYAGLGDLQSSMNAIAIASGAGVRVGLEDNIWFDTQHKVLANNAMLLNRIHQLAEIHERELMSASEMRKVLNLQVGHGAYGRAM